jgi:hypothetical protein
MLPLVDLYLVCDLSVANVLVGFTWKYIFMGNQNRGSKSLSRLVQPPFSFGNCWNRRFVLE